MTEVMGDWKQRRRGGLSYDGGGGGPNKESHVTIPLGQGEWDEELGIPLCVVCHSVRLVVGNCYDIGRYTDPLLVRLIRLRS